MLVIAPVSRLSFSTALRELRWLRVAYWLLTFVLIVSVSIGNLALKICWHSWSGLKHEMTNNNLN